MNNFYTNVISRGNAILFRGIIDGIRKEFKVHGFTPTLYIPTNERSEWKTIDGSTVAPIQPGTIKECREFVEQYKSVSNFTVYGMTDYAAQWISENYESDALEYDERLVRIFNVDIEVESKNGFPDPEVADQEILSVTIKDSLENTFHVWCLQEYTGANKTAIIHVCRSERDLINSILTFWSKNCPDVITGWNVRFFDIAYLVNRIKAIGMEAKLKLLSPWGVINEKNITIQGTTKQTYEFLGITIMDAIELYKKYTYTKQESYKLGYIARIEELGVEKITYTGTLQELYENDFNKFIDYNIMDVVVVDKLLEKHKFINIVLGIAYKAKVNWQTVYSPVSTWDIYIYNYFKKNHIAIPPENRNIKSEQYEGAFVKEPVPGKYKWVVSLDLDSLYPNAARQWNISPDTLIDFDIPQTVMQATIDDMIDKKTDLSFASDNNVSFTANKAVFRKDFMGCLPELFGQLYNERKIAKQKMISLKQELQKTSDSSVIAELEFKIQQLHNYQLTTKIFLNSAYGALGNTFFRYYDIRLAEAITVSCKLVIQWAELRLNKYINTLSGTVDKNYVIMVDTDALYINFDPLVQKLKLTDTKKIIDFLDKLCKDKIQPKLNQIFAELFEYTNAFEPHMNMKRENIAESCVVVAKKRYAMSVWDSEGVRYEKPKTKITGIEAVRSSTPEFCRTKIKKALDIILNGTEEELQAYIESVKEEFNTLNASAVAFPRGINDIEKYASDSNIYIKGSPIHVKGSLIYNHMVRTMKLTKKYQSIRDGDKIRFLYLKKPNSIKDTVIAFPDDLPIEFCLEKYIDYTMQFEKTLLDPIQHIVKNIGWNATHVSSLAAFF